MFVGRCWYDGKQVGGLGEYLMAHDWQQVNNGPHDWDSIKAACAVLGNPKGSRGDWSHAAFGVGPRKINAHTSDICNSDDTEPSHHFDSIQAVLCPPDRCKSCDCGPCQTCDNGRCVNKCTNCQKCVGGQCVAKCDAGNCETCESGTCRTKCGGCQKCSGGSCVDNSDNICPNKCTKCQGGDCVKTTFATTCEVNQCMKCVDAACVKTAKFKDCEANKLCNLVSAFRLLCCHLVRN